jgi:virulence factor Mce-like protein
MINVDRLKLEVKRALRPALLLVGLMILGTSSFVLLASQTNFNNPFKDKYKVWATFDGDIKGSQPGKQLIMIAGVKVGVVGKADLTKDNRAKLRLDFEKQYGKIYKNAKIRLRPVTPLQDMYIDVQRGTPSAGVVPDGGTVGTEQTVTPVDISRIMNTFDAPTRKRMRPLLSEMGTALGDHSDQLYTAFERLAPFLRTTQKITQVMSRHKRALAGAVHNLGALTSTLGERDRELRGFARNGNSVLSRLARSDAPLAATIRELGPTMAAIQGSFASVRAATTDLDPATQALQRIAGPLPEGLRELRGFSTEATPALNALRSPLRKLTPLVTNLRPTARALDQAFQRLQPQATRLDGMTQLIDACRDGNAGRQGLATDYTRAGLADFFHNTISVMKFEDRANGAIPRSDAAEGSTAAGGRVDDGSATLVGTCTDPFPSGAPMAPGTP